MMPVVICNYCEYMGKGRTLQDAWNDAQKHEVEVHEEDLREEMAPDSFEVLKKRYGGKK